MTDGMECVVVMGGRRRRVRLDSQSGRVTIDGETIAFDFVPLPAAQGLRRFSVLLAGRSLTVTLAAPAELQAGGEADAVAYVGGGEIGFSVEDPRKLRRARQGLEHAGRVNLTAPMTGRLIRWLVAPGARVAARQPLLVLEAMKMQNEVRSPKAGVLLQQAAAEGQAVKAGEILAELE